VSAPGQLFGGASDRHWVHGRPPLTFDHNRWNDGGRASRIVGNLEKYAIAWDADRQINDWNEIPRKEVLCRLNVLTANRILYSLIFLPVEDGIRQFSKRYRIKPKCFLGRITTVIPT